MNNYKPLYHYQQRPPFYTLLFLSFQYLFITVSWQFITVSIISAANASQLTKESILSTTLLVCGVITFLQSHSMGWLGGKQLLPPSSNPAYTGASLLAVHTGGLPLLYGMTLFSGVLEMLASPFIRLVKYILPNQYIGLIVMLIGFEVSGLGLVRLLAYQNSPHYFGNLTLGCATVFLTLFIQIKSHSLVKYFSYMITAVLGSVAYFVINGANQNFSPLLAQVSWIQLPTFSAFSHWHFSFELVTPFFIASLISVCKVIGSVSVLQQLKAEAVVVPDFTNISKANLADGLGTFLCGLIGGTGVNASSTCMALSVETRVNNRYVAYVTALMMVIVAICGKLMFLLLMIPSVIIGGLLIVLGSTLILYGLKMSLKSIMEDNVALMIFCLALVIGLSRGIFIQFYTHLPILVKMLTESEIVTGTVFVVLVNAITLLCRRLLRWHLS